MANKLKRIAIGLMALSMRLDAYAIQRGLTMDAAHPKDPDPKNWRTINGSKVHLTEGKIDGGAGGKFTGKEWTGKTKHEFTPKEKATESDPMPIFNKLPEESQKKLEHATAHALTAWDPNEDEDSMKASVQKANKLLKEFCVAHGITPAQKDKIKELVQELKTGAISPSQFKEGVAKTVNPSPAYVPKKMDEHAYTNLSSKGQQDIDDLASLAAYKQKKTDFDDPVLDFLKGKIKKKNNLDDKEMQGVKHAYEELQNGEIDKTTFKNAVASIAYYGVHVSSSPKPAAVPQPKVQTQITAQPKPGQLQTKGLAKIELTKATTGISTPKGTLGLYAAPNWKGVIDPCFKNFEEKYGKQQIAKFTKDEHDAVYRYTQTWTHLRDYLCYGTTVSSAGIYTKEDLQREVDLISAGLSKMEHPNMWVKRGGSLKDWATKENFDGATFEDLQRMQKDGAVFTNASFLSTNPSERVTYGDQSVVRHFFVPKKAKGGYIRDASAHNEELEFLLDKGTKTRIMKVEKDKNGNIVTYEEVVLDD